MERYRSKRPYVRKAALIVLDAVRKGELVRPDRCESCHAEKKLEAHHDDYSRPLDVRWLCRLCHKGWHRHNGPGKAPALTKQLEK